MRMRLRVANLLLLLLLLMLYISQGLDASFAQDEIYAEVPICLEALVVPELHLWHSESSPLLPPLPGMRTASTTSFEHQHGHALPPPEDTEVSVVWMMTAELVTSGAEFG